MIAAPRKREGRFFLRQEPLETVTRTMPTMWDRLRANNKDEGVSPMDRKKLVDWQNNRPGGYASSGGGHQQQRSKGIVVGNSQYQVSVSAGPTPARPPRDYRAQESL